MQEFHLDKFKGVDFKVAVNWAPSGHDFSVLRVASLSTQGQHQFGLKISTEVNLILQKPGAIASIFSGSMSVSVPKCPFK